jgi:opacity protein-like surface antigen
MKLITLFFLLLISLTSQAQSQGHFGLNLQMGVPINQFRDNTEAVGFGVGGYILFPVSDSPLHFGLDVNYLVYGSDTKDEEVLINGFFDKYEVATNNNILLGHFITRFKPKTKFLIQPYFDVMLGFKYLYTRTKITDDSSSDPLETNTDYYDWAFSYGGAGGVHVNLNKNIKLELRILYLNGSKAKYLEKGSIQQDPNNPNLLIFDSKTSRTDMIIPQLGVSFFLD